MSEQMGKARASKRVKVLCSVPLGLVIVPSAVLVNKWLYLGKASLNQDASYLMLGLAVLGLSLMVLILPEIVKTLTSSLAELAWLVAMLFVATSLVISIGVQMYLQLDPQTLSILAVFAGIAALLFTFKNWVSWTFR